jgi:hypothetical protein
MAVPIPGTLPRLLEDGQTGSQRAGQFVGVKLTGIQALTQELLRLSTRLGEDGTKPLTSAARKAARPIMEIYKENISSVTGNLERSVTVREGRRKYPGVGIAVGGPVHVVSGKEWDVERKGAGNHSWLVEFGTGPRRAGTQGRRTYLNVHQRINGRMSRVNTDGVAFNNKQFERMGRGYYFLMGSINEENPERREGRGAFVKTSGGKTRPYTLGPGETYPAMPASHAMEMAIRRGRNESFSVLERELVKLIEQRRRR